MTGRNPPRLDRFSTGKRKDGHIDIKSKNPELCPDFHCHAYLTSLMVY
jgi:hypothetical protein